MDKSLGKNTLINIVGQGIPIVVALLTIPLVIRYLGDTRFGILTVAWVIIGTSTIFDLGMGRATTKFVAHAIGRNEFDKIPAIISCSTFVQIILGSIGGMVIIAVAPMLSTMVFTIPPSYEIEAQYVLVLSGISIPVVLISGTYLGLLEASHRFDIANVVRAVFTSLTYLSPLVGVAIGWDLIGIIGLMLALRAIQVVALYRISATLYPSIRWTPKYDHQQFRSMFNFGGWVSLTNILSPLQENMERLILAGLLPIAQLTYYSVPKDMLERIYILPGSLTAALFPTLTVIAGTRKEELLKLFVTVTKIIIISVVLPLFMVATLAHQLLSVWINKEFASIGSQVVHVLVLGVLASSLNLLAMTMFQCVGRPDITAKQQLVRFPIIGFVAWILIAKYGLDGAAISWSFGRLLALIMNWWAIAALQDWDIGVLIPRQIRISLIAPIAMAFIYAASIIMLGDSVSPLEQLFIAGLSTMLLTFTFWQSVLTRDERKWVYFVASNALRKR